MLDLFVTEKIGLCSSRDNKEIVCKITNQRCNSLSDRIVYRYPNQTKLKIFIAAPKIFLIGSAMASGSKPAVATW